MAHATEKTMSSYTAGFTLAAAIAIIFNFGLTLFKETNPDLLAYMKGLTGHHWITHGFAVTIVFFVFGFMLSSTEDVHKMSYKEVCAVLVGSVLIGGLGLLGFYFFE